ncbi:hypothetical protein BDY24DRAFT_414966 [Mrakia frigida]|uniref:uncharacterized protein n=1 Tax=Mrakia frigida TaxID=29902 RepID=UPI003FCC2264
MTTATLLSLLPLLLLSPSSSSALPTPSASPSNSTSSFNCTPFDFSLTQNFPRGTPLYLADLLSFSLDTNVVVPLGFDGSSNATLGRVAADAQGNGSWGFEVCTGLEGIDTSSTTPGIQSLFGHITYTSPNSSLYANHTCVSISTPNATDYSHLPLIAVPCEYNSSALNEDAVFILGPGAAGFNVSYAAGPASFNGTMGLDLMPTGGSSFSKFFFQRSD